MLLRAWLHCVASITLFVRDGEEGTNGSRKKHSRQGERPLPDRRPGHHRVRRDVPRRQAERVSVGGRGGQGLYLVRMCVAVCTDKDEHWVLYFLKGGVQKGAGWFGSVWNSRVFYVLASRCFV